MSPNAFSVETPPPERLDYELGFDMFGNSTAFPPTGICPDIKCSIYLCISDPWGFESNNTLLGKKITKPGEQVL